MSLASLDVRSRPDHRAEMTSQLLLGEVVRLGARRGGWCRVVNEADGYRGWVRLWGLVCVPGGRAGRWKALASARVSAPLAHARAGARAATSVSPLCFGCRVIPGRRVGAARVVELPDGRRGWIPADAVRLGSERAPSLLWRVRTLLGTPYLWGGRTPAGYDCSAFVQQVLLEQAVSLPRDAHEQYRVTRAVKTGREPEEGDLAFFSASGSRMEHVGLALGGGYFAHARGKVAISSLDPKNPLYDRELSPQFTGWRRPRS